MAGFVNASERHMVDGGQNRGTGGSFDTLKTAAEDELKQVLK
jgi:hypothetical protein